MARYNALILKMELIKTRCRPLSLFCCGLIFIDSDKGNGLNLALASSNTDHVHTQPTAHDIQSSTLFNKLAANFTGRLYTHNQSSQIVASHGPNVGNRTGRAVHIMGCWSGELSRASWFVPP